MLRHSSVQITQDLYTEVVSELAREAAERTSAMIPRKKARDTKRVPNRSPRLESVQRKVSA